MIHIRFDQLSLFGEEFENSRDQLPLFEEKFENDREASSNLVRSNFKKILHYYLNKK